MTKNNLNKQLPIVSVIVITYNQQNTIRQSLDSILNQVTDFTYEIIIGDDASIDNTYDLCKEYQKKYPQIIRLFRNKENKGILNNYYDCILRANGKYIADCAGDDFWIDKLKLQKQVNILEKDPEISLVHTGWHYYNPQSHTFSESDPTGTREKFLKSILNKNDLVLPILRRDAPIIIHLCTAMYRKDVILDEYNKDTFLFRNKEFSCEDIQLEVVMAASGKIAYLPDITLAYRHGHISATSDESFEKIFNFYFGTLKLNRYLQQKYKIGNSELESYYDTLIPYLYAQLFYSGKRQHIKYFETYTSKIDYKPGWKTVIYKILLKIKWLHLGIIKIIGKHD